MLPSTSKCNGIHIVKIPQPESHPDRVSQIKILAIMAAACVLNGAMLTIRIPYFGVVAAERGLSQTLINMVNSCFALTKMVASLYAGRLVPVVGIGGLYAAGLATAGGATILFGAANHIQDTRLFFAACLLLRALEAAGSAAVSTCGYTVAASQFPQRVSLVIAMFAVSLTTSKALAPAAAGALYAATSYGVPFYVLGVVAVLLSPAVLRLVPEARCDTDRRLPLISTLAICARSRGNWLCLATVQCFVVAMTSIDASAATYANEALQLPPQQIGMLYLVSSLTSVVVSLLWNWAGDAQRWNPYLLMSGCLLPASIGILILAPSPLLHLKPSWWLMCAGLTIQEVGLRSAFIPCYKTMIDASIAVGLNDNVSTRAFLSGFLNTAQAVAAIVGPTLGGLLVDFYGFPVMTTVMAVNTAVVGAVILLSQSAAESGTKM